MILITLILFFISASTAADLPDKMIAYKLVPPVLTYNRTARLFFNLGPPTCQRDKFHLNQVNRDNEVVLWKAPSLDALWANDTTFYIRQAGFKEWGNYSAQCFAPSFFSYQPYPLAVPIPVNPRILALNFTRWEDEILSGPLDPSEVPELDENAPTVYDFDMPLDNQQKTWLLKFDVGSGYYPSDELGFFNITGLDNLTAIATPSRRPGYSKVPYDVPYEGFPDGSTYRFAFDLTAEVAATKWPSNCSAPMEAAVYMKSNITASRHAVNLTIHLKYLAQDLQASARLEGGGCIFRCAIKSACPLLDDLKLELLAGSKTLPTISSQQSTLVEIKLTPQDCDHIVALSKNNTGTLVCTAKNQVGEITLPVPLRDVAGISSLERGLERIAGEGLPFWAKITIPVACIVALLLFIVVIILCVQKCKGGKKKPDATPVPTTETSNNNNNNNSNNNNTNLTGSRDNVANHAAEQSTRSGDYRGPVSTRGQTYRMPQQEAVTDEYDDEHEPYRARILPPTPGGSSWEGSFSNYEPSVASSRRAPEPVMIAPMTSTAPVPRLGGQPVGVYSRQPLPVVIEPPVTSSVSVKPSSKMQPPAYTYGNPNTAYEVDQSYAKANRQAAARYMPNVPADNTNAPSQPATNINKRPPNNAPSFV